MLLISVRVGEEEQDRIHTRHYRNSSETIAPFIRTIWKTMHLPAAIVHHHRVVDREAKACEIEKHANEVEESLASDVWHCFVGFMKAKEIVHHGEESDDQTDSTDRDHVCVAFPEVSTGRDECDNYARKDDFEPFDDRESG